MRTSNHTMLFAGLVAACSLVVAVASAQTVTKETATVTANAPIYIGAEVSQTPLRVAAPGTVLKVLQQQGDWTQVEFNDPQLGPRVGWVQRWLLTFNTGVQPMDLSVPSSLPLRPCAIVKFVKEKGKYHIPQEALFIEGSLPAGMTFNGSKTTRKVNLDFAQWRTDVLHNGGRIILLDFHSDAIGLEDARVACRVWQEKRR
jgi:hypothetical protein